MSFEQLLAWTAKRPDWQQDALRRIAQQGELSDSDLDELRLQIESDAGLTVEKIIESRPLTADHLTEVGSNAPRTVLASLGPVKNVDRLESDQRPLRFAANGITLIEVVPENRTVR